MAAYTSIDNPELYFQTKLYTGTGSEIAATLDGSENMQPNLVWIKARTDAESHKLYDSVRGATKHLETDTNDVEATEAQGLKSFDSDGFTIGTYSSINASSSHTYVAWCWKEASEIFDIITYSGTGSNIDLSHNLSAVPGFFAIKNIDVDQAWRVYHKNMTTANPYSNRMVFSETGAQSTSALGLDADPTSSVINIGTDTGCTNASGEDFVCYAWKEIQGYSKFGKFTGNGNTSGTFVHTGFRPAWVICKRTDSTGSWYICDNKRLGFNARPNNSVVGNPELAAQSNRSEAGGNTNVMDIFSNGFKLIQSGAEINASGGTFIYMAYAEQPFVNSKGVPANAR